MLCEPTNFFKNTMWNQTKHITPGGHIQPPRARVCELQRIECVEAWEPDRHQLQCQFCYSVAVCLWASHISSPISSSVKQGEQYFAHWVVMRIRDHFCKMLAQSSSLNRSQLISTIDTSIRRTCSHGQHRKIGHMSITKEGASESGWQCHKHFSP